jgi:putative tryptophan/tyrosine transport system substrate-binding protein
VPVIGFLYTGLTADAAAPRVAAFRQGLSEAGFLEGRNVTVDYRWPGAQHDELRTLVAELMQRPITVIVGNTPPAMAAKSLTLTTPIVFVTGTDPVKVGLVASFNRPGGNATGVTFLTVELEANAWGCCTSYCRMHG